MAKRHSLIALLLCLCMMFGLSGCNENLPPETAPPASTAAPTTIPTTESVPTPLDIYTDAMAAMPSDLCMEIGVTRQIVIGSSKFVSSIKQTVTYRGIGTDDFAAKVTERASNGDFTLETTETYTAGSVHAVLDESRFFASMTPEEYIARFVPTALFDGSLYGQVTQQDDTITFSEATQLESWLLPDGPEPAQAGGTVTLAGDTIQSAQYKAVYYAGGAEVTVTVNQTFKQTVPQVERPANTLGYTPVGNIDALKFPFHAYCYLMKAKDIQATLMDSLVSQAAGYMANTQTQLYTSYTQGDPMIRIDQSIYELTSDGRELQTDICEIFRDGKYSYSENGNPPEYDDDVWLTSMEYYYQDILADLMPAIYDFQNVSLTEVNGLFLAEYIGNSDYGIFLNDMICQELFNDPDLLDDAASDYKDSSTFYISFDRYTGLPVAMGLTFEATHILDRQAFVLSRQRDYALDLASSESYKAITEDLPTENEPEDKATPLLYHVTGADGQEMWLFGTIHVGDSRTGFLPQELYDAFAASDALAIECNNTAFEEQLKTDDALSQQVSNAYFYANGTTTADHISDSALYDDALRLLKATGNYNMNAEYMKPSLWQQSIGNSMLGFGHQLISDMGMEYRLEALAKEQNKPIWEVESVMFQIQMTTGYSDALQELLLKDMVGTDTREYWESVYELYTLWCAGDEEALIEMLRDESTEGTEEEQKLYAEYDKAMSYDRNEGMLEVAKQYLESGDTVFYAVGLAHLLAENGLVFTLRDAGYTVELVTYK